jgi:hypothetical protein
MLRKARFQAVRRPKPCRQVIDITTIGREIPSVPEQGNKSGHQGDKIDDQEIKSSKHRIRDGTDWGSCKGRPGFARLQIERVSISAMTPAMSGAYLSFSRNRGART